MGKEIGNVNEYNKRVPSAVGSEGASADREDFGFGGGGKENLDRLTVSEEETGGGGVVFV